MTQPPVQPPIVPCPPTFAPVVAAMPVLEPNILQQALQLAQSVKIGSCTHEHALMENATGLSKSYVCSQSKIMDHFNAARLANPELAWFFKMIPDHHNGENYCWIELLHGMSLANDREHLG